MIRAPQNSSAVKESILVVDDHASARESMAHVLQAEGRTVRCAASAVEALELLEKKSFDVIITDMKMPGVSGLEFIRRLEQRECRSQIVMVTAYASVASAVEAMRHGAFDYIEKPFDVDTLEELVGRALRFGENVSRSEGAANSNAANSNAAAPLLGASPAMEALRDRIQQVASTAETVLITGESGVGKELVARAIHASSPRHAETLVSLNCPALSPQLMESELFGHVPGAFTSAESARVGRFELADKGSILLDEISEIDLSLQAKLLRVLQERTFERVGDCQTMHVDVRVLATTNRDIRGEVEAGRFREDLYYRLAVVPLDVPPLRERRSDIILLCEHCLQNVGQRIGRPPRALSENAKDLLTGYDWPGNVRELDNIMTRSSVLHSAPEIDADDLRPWLMGESADAARGPTASLKVGAKLHEMERMLIESTLEKLDGHRGKTAEALGIGVRTLANKLKSYGYGPRDKSLARAA